MLPIHNALCVVLHVNVYHKDVAVSMATHKCVSDKLDEGGEFVSQLGECSAVQSDQALISGWLVGSGSCKPSQI